VSAPERSGPGERSGVDLRDVHGELLWMRAFRPDPVPAGWRLKRDGLDGAAYEHRSDLFVIFSGNREADGRRWLHLSASHRRRVPTWDELAAVKEAFLGPDRYAAIVFPPRDKWVDLHPYCLHLWSPLDGGWVMPEFSSVRAGVRGI
jgi:hypothetical protein